MNRRRVTALAIAAPALLAAANAMAHEALPHVHLGDGTPVFLAAGLGGLAVLAIAAVVLVRGRRQRARAIGLGSDAASRRRRR